MKIKGFDKAKITDEVVLPRGKGTPLTIKIQALPIGTDDRGAALFPRPTPPERPVIKSKPKVEGAAPLYEYNDDGSVMKRIDAQDPEYLAALKERARGFGAFILYHGIADEKVSWETPVMDAKPAFYHAIYKEMEDSGLFLFGDGAILVESILTLSNMDKKKVEAAKRDFFLSADAAGGK